MLILGLLVRTRLDKRLNHRRVTRHRSHMQRHNAILTLGLFVGARPDKRFNYGRVTPLRSQMQRRPAILILGLLVRARANERIYRGRVTTRYGRKQSQPALIAFSCGFSSPAIVFLRWADGCHLLRGWRYRVVAFRFPGRIK
jgi:hypothetical protein